MALFAERIKASEAKELSLVNYVVLGRETEEETAKVVARLCKGPPSPTGCIKRLFHRSPGRTLLPEQSDARGRALWQFRHAVTRCAWRD